MENAQHRHDISDEMWEIISPNLPGQSGSWGGSNANDTRTFINGVFWILRTGAPWRDLPPSCGKWNSTAKRYGRWCENGTWSKFLEQLIENPDYEWLMTDAGHVKAHPHAAGAAGGNQDMGHVQKGAKHEDAPCR
jgi:transposase